MRFVFSWSLSLLFSVLCCFSVLLYIHSGYSVCVHPGSSPIYSIGLSYNVHRTITVCLVLCASVCSCLQLISDFMLFLWWVLHGFLQLPHHCYGFFFLFVCLFCRSLTSNLPNVNLPNVNLQIPKVPNLPVPVAGLSVNLPQMPSFSTPSWMAAIYDSECVFN